jgi:hypothetical protein
MAKPKPVEEEPKPSSLKLRFKVQTPNGEYTVNRPTGRAGVIHFTLISKALPTTINPETGDVEASPADQERFIQSFEEWSAKVLPEIFVDGPVASVKEMPGEDQYALFLAMFSTVNLNGDLFRFVE